MDPVARTVKEAKSDLQFCKEWQKITKIHPEDTHNQMKLFATPMENSNEKTTRDTDVRRAKLFYSILQLGNLVAIIGEKTDFTKVAPRRISAHISNAFHTWYIKTLCPTSRQTKLTKMAAFFRKASKKLWNHFLEDETENRDDDGQCNSIDK